MAILDIGRRLPSAQHGAPAAALPARADALVIGAGVVGLSIGWRLAEAGLATVVIDRGRAGAGASLAATGMLAAAAEFETGGEDLLPFALQSQRLWPAFRDELQAASGLSVGYEETGTLLVALTRDETERLRARHDMQRRVGLATHWLNGLQAQRAEPALRPPAAAILCPDDHQVDPRQLTPALARAFVRAGGTLIEDCGVEALERAGGRCAGIATPQGVCLAPTIVFAPGAWAGASFLPDLAIPVRPLRGQSLALRSTRASPGPAHIVWSEQIHIAPKADGRIIAGATVEEAGFESANTAGALYALLEALRRALPSIEDMPVEAVWSGFRPTSIDDAPILGTCGLPGLLLATGHHRNGILLAPATAAAIVALARDGVAPPEARPLHLARFGGQS